MKKSKTKTVLSTTMVLLIVFSVISPTNAVLQAPLIQWQRTYGASSGDSLTQASDGGFAVAAKVSGGPSSGFNEIIKTDKEGNVLWNVTIGETPISDEWIMATSDGGFAVARRSDNSSITGSIIKVDAQGKVQWNQTYAQPGYGAFINYAIKTKDNGFALIGQMASGNTWLIKTDSEGNVQWDKTYENFNGTLIAQTNDGNYVIAGDSGGNQTTLFKSYLAKTDQQGNIQLIKVYDSQLGFRPRSLITTSDGGLMLAGYNFPNDTSVSAFALKTDTNGNFEWNKTFGENSGFRLAIEDSQGGYIFAGGVYTSQPRYSARLIKTDAFGTSLWETSYKGQGNGYVYSLTQTANNSYVFTGATSKVNSSTTQMWMIKVAPTQNEPLQLNWIVSTAIAAATIAIIILATIIYNRKKPNSKHSPQ
jgi:hypothetical protein